MKRPIRMLTALGLIAALGACSDNAAEKQAAAPIAEATTVAPEPTAAPVPAEPTIAVPSKIVSLSADSHRDAVRHRCRPAGDRRRLVVELSRRRPGDRPVGLRAERRGDRRDRHRPGRVVRRPQQRGRRPHGAATSPWCRRRRPRISMTRSPRSSSSVPPRVTLPRPPRWSRTCRPTSPRSSRTPGRPTSRAGLTFYHELDPTYFSATSQTFIGQIYSAFGLVNIADEASTSEDGGYPQLSAEYILAARPGTDLPRRREVL